MDIVPDPNNSDEKYLMILPFISKTCDLFEIVAALFQYKDEEIQEILVSKLYEFKNKQIEFFLPQLWYELKNN